MKPSAEAYNQAVLDANAATKDLVEAYLASVPVGSLAKAQEEDRIWRAVPKKAHKVISDYYGYQGQWLRDTIDSNGIVSDFRARHMTLHKVTQGFDVECVWNYLDANGPSATLLRVYSNVNPMVMRIPKDQRKERRDLFESLMQRYLVLNEILPEKAEEPKEPQPEKAPRIRSRRDPSIRPPRPRRERVSPALGIADQGPITLESVEDPARETKEAWTKIVTTFEETVRPILKDRLGGAVEDHEWHALFDDFKYETQACFQVLFRRIRSKERSSNASDFMRAKQAEIVQAANVLGVIVTSRGTPDMKLAKKNWLTLSARFHPDRSPDPRNPDPKFVEQYVTVQKAWAILSENI